MLHVIGHLALEDNTISLVDGPTRTITNIIPPWAASYALSLSEYLPTFDPSYSDGHGPQLGF